MVRFRLGLTSIAALITAAIACALESGGLPSRDESDAEVKDGPASGCETGSACASTCVDLQSDPKNCGACGEDCTVKLGATAGCVQAKCLSCLGIDFMSDAKNCGACGHDCVGGLCTAGKCQPSTLAVTNNVRAMIVTTDGSMVYWLGEATNFGPATGIYRADVASMSSPGQLLLGSLNQPLDLDVAQGVLYFAAFNAISSISADGGAPTFISVANYAYGLSASSSGLYWTNYFANYPTVLRAELDGGNITTIANNGAGALPHGVTGDDQRAFWIEDTRVVRADDGGSSTLASPVMGKNGQVVGIRRVAVDSTRVYWTDPNVGMAANGRVLSIAKDGSQDASSPNILAANQSDPRCIALDAKYVYWTDYGSGPNTGSIMRAIKDGSQSAEMLATGLDQPIGIAVDGKAIYVALYSSLGKIIRLIKDK